MLDVVMQGTWRCGRRCRSATRIYADPDATDERLHARRRARSTSSPSTAATTPKRAPGSILTDAGIDPALHNGPMREVAPGWKLRVLLAQALFSKPDVLLLDEPTNNLDINSIRWLESVLNNYDATMVIISHDRHFLNQVCTHIADVDYGQIRIWPGNYDDFMLASTQARELVAAANAKAKDRISELQEFVRRFSANASKARQATSRRRQIDKIKIEEMKPSSRQNPFIRFEQGKKLYRNAVAVETSELSLSGHECRCPEKRQSDDRSRRAHRDHRRERHRQDDADPLPRGRPDADQGRDQVGGECEPGYMPQDPQAEFANKVDLFTWMSEWRAPSDDDQAVRGTLGRLLFSGDEIRKSVKVLSGGEKGRMIYGKLMLTKPNVLLLDEPTNHMDMETIESLQIALEKYPGTLHVRIARSGIRRRARESNHRMKPGGTLVDFKGTYDEYLKSQGVETP